MIAKRFDIIKENVNSAARKSGYKPEGITIVAVTKTVAPDIIKKAIEIGIDNYGENRIQEALPKIKQLPSSIKWHFIGYLQTNKVRDVVGNFCMVHSLDRVSLADALEKKAKQIRAKIPVLVQVNVSGEKSKFGIAPEETEDFLTEIKDYEYIEVKGLMTIAPFTDDPEETRPFFRQLRLLKESINIPGIELSYLSMGMSNDYIVAVEEGANIIRVGSALFGSRD